MITEEEFKKTPPVTLFYSISIAIVSIISLIYDKYSFIKIIKLDYKKVFNNYEIWRLITTFFYIGKPTPKLAFKILLYYKRMKSNENKFKKKKKLAEFIMMLIYLMIIIHICNIIGLYQFNIKQKSFLSHQLMFSIILINSKREPNKYFRFYFLRIENKYVPFFLFTLRAAKSGSSKILSNALSFLPGLIYYWLKDVVPTLGIINYILITPKFLIDFIEEKVYKKKNKIRINHNNENNNNNVRDNNRNYNQNNNINNLNNNMNNQ
jgi:Derlin-2/3